MTTKTMYQDCISRRRAFALPGYPTLADAGFDGEYVSPIHLSSGNISGPMLISKDWLDYPSAVRHRAELRIRGYLPQIPFNKVLDLALDFLKLRRADVYVTPIFHLLTPRRSSNISAEAARACFNAVGRFELMGRRPVALGLDSARVLSHFGVDHIPAPHPSARIGSFADRAKQIAKALEMT